MSQVEEQPECPLCMEPLEVDDLNFFPCTCGYQICRFCWHRIRTDENGLCPACRKAYPENPADFKPLSQEQVVKMKAEKRHKEQQRKQKATESRKHLANVRVVQKNLVFVVGLPIRLADTTMLKKHEYFGKFGRIHKVVINQSTTYAGATGPSASAYVTYSRCDDALRAIEAVNNISVDSKVLKTSLGTTKYCSHFIKSQTCPKPDCMYLHDFGDTEASFTKEEMQQGKHQEYEKKLHEQLNLMGTVERKTNSSPQGTKQDSWPLLNNGTVLENEPKPVPPLAQPIIQQSNLKGKRYGKDKVAQEKGTRKGKEKENNGLQTSQSESCINQARIGHHSHRASSMFVENDGKQLDSYSDEPSPPDSPIQVHNGYHDRQQPSPSPSPSPSLSSVPTPPSPLSLPTPPSPPTPSEVEIQDNDWGFDPFQETQKGLAELLEKELQIQQKPEIITQAQPTINHLPYLNNYQGPHLDPAILSQLHSNNQHRVTSNNRLDRRPMPPPGFAASLPHSHQHPLTQQHVDLYRGINGTKPFYLPNGNNGVPKLSEWPESLRSLVHDSNNPHHHHHHHHHTQYHHTQHNPASMLHRQDKGWNHPNNYADWTALDPAIVSSSRPHVGANMYSAPSPYNQGMGVVGGNMSGMGPTGWAHRYHDTYFKQHIHNTSMPPPGFSLLHQSGSGLKPSLSSGIETMD